MQWPISYWGIASIDNEGNLENLIGKVDKVGEFWKTGKADGDSARYLLIFTFYLLQDKIKLLDNFLEKLMWV